MADFSQLDDRQGKRNQMGKNVRIWILVGNIFIKIALLEA
jgi:hypothetical protein